MEIHIDACVEQPGQDARSQVLDTVFRETAGDQGVIVGPHRTIVIRNRVVSSLLRADGPHSPAREEIWSEQAVRPCGVRAQAWTRGCKGNDRHSKFAPGTLFFVHLMPSHTCQYPY